MSFADMLQQSQANPNDMIQQMQAKIKEEQNSGSSRDIRFWVIPRDKDQYGSARIRLLPWGMGTSALPWAHYTQFNIRGYYERSLKDLGQPDPMIELNQAHWNLAAAMGEKQSDGKFKGKETDLIKRRNAIDCWICNILVLSDPARKENEGKVFLFRFGRQIMKIIESKIAPIYQDQEAIPVFDYLRGADFSIRSKGKKIGRVIVPNYEDSTFEYPSPLAQGNVQVLENIHNSLYDLTEFSSLENYKSYTELTRLMIAAIGANEVARIKQENLSPQQMIMGGTSPFGTGQQMQQASAQDPLAMFGQQQQQPQAQVTDPLAQFGGHQHQNTDPLAQFGGQPQQEQPEQQDPLAMFGQQQQEPVAEEKQEPQASQDIDNLFANFSL